MPIATGVFKISTRSRKALRCIETAAGVLASVTQDWNRRKPGAYLKG